MRIALRDASQEEWNKAYADDKNSTYYQSVNWNSLWAAFQGYELAPKRVYADDAFVGILPMLVYKRWYESQYISGIRGYGGILDAQGVALHQRERINEAISNTLKTFYLLDNLFALFNESIGVIPSIRARSIVNIQYLDLRNGFDVQFKKWSKGHRSAAKKGIRDGVIVKRAKTLEEWHQYYDVYLDSLRRWGDTASSRYPWELFNSIFELHDDRIVLWIAIFGEDVVAGSLCFYGLRHIAYWHGASMESHFDIKAPHVLQYRIAENAADNHIYWYDMLSSGNHAGVEKFKKGFAAETLSVAQIDVRPIIFSSLSKMKARLMKLHWQTKPKSV